MNVDDLVAMIGAVLVSGTGTAAITAWIGRTRIKAQATRIITDAAAQVVDLQEAHIKGLTGRIDRLERQVSADRAAQVKHTAWDRIARQRLQEAGIDVPEPPPLYAPEVA